MAELTPRRPRTGYGRLETYGALFAAPRTARSASATSAVTPIRGWPHVGDPDRAANIRTMQQKIVSRNQDDHKETGDYEANLQVTRVTVTTLKDNETGSPGR